jgi:hypothetical protein
VSISVANIESVLRNDYSRLLALLHCHTATAAANVIAAREAATAAAAGTALNASSGTGTTTPAAAAAALLAASVIGAALDVPKGRAIALPMPPATTLSSSSSAAAAAAASVASVPGPISSTLYLVTRGAVLRRCARQVCLRV